MSRLHSHRRSGRRSDRETPGDGSRMRADPSRTRRTGSPEMRAARCWTRICSCHGMRQLRRPGDRGWRLATLRGLRHDLGLLELEQHRQGAGQRPRQRQPPRRLQRRLTPGEHSSGSPGAARPTADAPGLGRTTHASAVRRQPVFEPDDLVRVQMPAHTCSVDAGERGETREQAAAEIPVSQHGRHVQDDWLDEGHPAVPAM